MELYPFAYFDPLRRKWMRARYVATLEDIAKRYPAFRITGAPELRTEGGGGTAGHLARSPCAPRSEPIRSCGDSGIERTDRAEE